MTLLAVTFLYSCNNAGTSEENKRGVVKKILQGADGTISLVVDKADCYSDMLHPSTNTAEWNIVVSKSGRYNVWLSSATRDTTNMHYNNSVMLSIHDNRIEAHPACDKVIHNSSDVRYPYFRADSFIGSLYIQDTGVYNVQVISDKIIPKDYKDKGSAETDHTKLLSVFLTPIAR